jgi:peptidoglycan hydrolase-like protein with peptidoglycan-binding domain
MKIFLPFLLFVMMVGPLRADDQTLSLQQRLKDQGFYYGDVDGRGGEETSAAIRRYQIRYGLRVTGQLNEETLRSLGMSRDSAARPAPGYQNNAGPSNRPPDNQYQQQPPYQQPTYPQAPYQQPPRVYYGRPVPPRSGPEDYDEAQPVPFSAPEAATTYPRLFAATIYERAPSQIQENVLYAVQGELMRRGLFRARIDGRPGPATSDAILRFQQEQGLPISGRLDNETLNALRAFPGQRNGPPEEFSRPHPGERIYRGYPAPF